MHRAFARSAASRFVLATVFVGLSYALVLRLGLPQGVAELQGRVHAALQAMMVAIAPTQGATTQPTAGRTEATANPPIAAAAGVMPATHRAAAFRLGATLGFVAVLSHAQAMRPTAEREAALREMSARLQPDADLLAVGPVVVMQGRTMDAAARLPTRAEADESGMAARVGARWGTTARSIFMAGLHTGMASFWIWALGNTDLKAHAPYIEKHAVAAALPSAWWQPLLTAPPGDATRARQDYHERIARLVDRLAQP